MSITVKLTEQEILQAHKSYAEQPYEHNEFVLEEDLQRKRFKQKQVIMLQAKTRGIKTFDRLGDWSY